MDKEATPSMAHPHHHHHHHEKLPPPHAYVKRIWDSDYIRDALEKSAASLETLRPGRGHDHDHERGLSHLIRVTDVRQLFLIDSSGAGGSINYLSSVGPLEWGTKDIMIDLGDLAVAFPPHLAAVRRKEYLRDAANFSGGAVHLLYLNNLSPHEAADWLEALSQASDRDGGAAPASLIIRECHALNVSDLLTVLKSCHGLHHLSLQVCSMHGDECITKLSDLCSLTSLHLLGDVVSPEFVESLADLHPSHSALAASLQRLDLHGILMSHGPKRRSFRGFLHHWPQLKELTLVDGCAMKNEYLLDCMEELAQSPARLYRLTLGRLFCNTTDLDSNRAIVAAVVEALSRSGIPFLELKGLENMDPAIEAQIARNQRLYMLGGDLEKVSATSMRLFICRDPDAGKTKPSLLSTMHSIYAGKKHTVRAFRLPRVGRIAGDRKQEIQFQAIEKDGLRLSVWEMAGRPEFRAFQDFMFPNLGQYSSHQAPPMFMFVWSSITHRKDSRDGMQRKQEEEFEIGFRYWLKFLAAKSRQLNITPKVIVVFTRADRMDLCSSDLSFRINSLRSEFKEVIHIVDPTFAVDAARKESVKTLAEFVFGIAKQMLEGIEVYTICTQVSSHLSNHLKTSNQRIITWSQFSEICRVQLSVPDDEAKLKAIASSLIEFGIILYVNITAHIVLDPNWFCTQIMRRLIHIPERKASKTMAIHKYYTSRGFLEAELESLTKSQVKGSILVDLMEAMDLCFKVPNNLDNATRNGDYLFVPRTLTDPKELDLGMEQLQWRSSSGSSHDNASSYIGRRLACENRDLNFLTPSLFPRIQVLFNEAFQVVNVDTKLDKDFISICIPMPTMEIIVVFCQTKADNVIDVLVRTETNNQEDMARMIDYVEDHIIETVIKVYGQPKGIQGVKLIESVIRPDSLHDPSMAQNREDQHMEITHLKQQLRNQLEQGRPPCHIWKNSSKYMNGSTTTSWIDLLGYKNYLEVLMSFKSWLKEVADELMENDEAHVLQQHQTLHQDRTTSGFQNSPTSLQEDQISEEGDEEAQSLVGMSRPAFMDMESTLNSIKEKVLASHQETIRLHDKVDEMKKTMIDELHKEIDCMRTDVVSKVMEAADKVLNCAMENESENQLPRLVFLTTKGASSDTMKVVTSLRGDHHLLSVQIKLCCEDRGSPHLIEEQMGITLTDSFSEALHRAIPYANRLLRTFTMAARVGINILAPPTATSTTMLGWLPGLNAGIGKEELSATSLRVCSWSRSFGHWQECLVSVLAQHGGVTDENIAKKFLLRRAMYTSDGSNRVTWLCHEHYERQTPFPLLR